MKTPPLHTPGGQASGATLPIVPAIAGQRVAIVLAGSYSGLGAEVREGRVGVWLAESGNHVRLYRIATPGAADSTGEFRHGEQVLPLMFFAAANPTERHHAHIAPGMFRDLEAYAPDIILVKGFGYRLVESIVRHWHQRARIVGIVGGLVTSDAQHCAHLLIEDEYQFGPARAIVGPDLPVEVLPKLIDWDLIERLKDTERRMDIVNVGSVDSRKRQRIILETFGAEHVEIVGGGPLLDGLKADYGDRPNVHFRGHLSRFQALQAIRGAKLLVHVANFEGYPRVFAEAGACATPVATLRETTPVMYAEERGIVLSTLNTLKADVLALLADPDRLTELGRRANAYLRATATEDRMRACVARAVNGWDQN